MGDLRHLRQRCDDGPVTWLEPFTGVTHPHAFLMAVLVQQGKRIEIERVALGADRQFLQCPALELGKRLGRTAPTAGKETRQRGLTGHRLDRQHLRHRRIMRQMRDACQLVRTTGNASDEP
jgi:hypothetical protein